MTGRGLEDAGRAAESIPRAGGGAGAPSARGFRVDAAWLLIAFVALLLLIPANLTIAALGSIGTPALVVGLGALVWWLGAQMNRADSTLSPPQPIRRAMFCFMIAVLISYVAATVRPIDGLELNGADRGLLLIASWLGIVLLASDGLIGLDRLETPLRLLVGVGAVVAIIGIAQFLTSTPIIDVIQLPGLTANTDLTSVYNRSGFNRAAGTSTHPIEFGVVLSMILPVALHFAFSDTHRNWFARWLPVAVIVVAVPITVSRSAVVGVAVALVILMPAWSRRRRRMSYLVIATTILGIFVAIPGMLGSLTKLFTGISDDGSALSRTDSYGLALDFISRSPLFGRGMLTFLPEYRILDNQYLALLIEVGLVGTIAIVALFTVTIVSALRIRRLSPDPRARSLGQSLGAMVAAGACTFATFDAFSFPQASGLMFLAIGFVGALVNTVRRDAGPAEGLSPAAQPLS